MNLSISDNISFIFYVVSFIQNNNRVAFVWFLNDKFRNPLSSLGVIFNSFYYSIFFITNFILSRILSSTKSSFYIFEQKFVWRKRKQKQKKTGKCSSLMSACSLRMVSLWPLLLEKKHLLEFTLTFPVSYY